MAKKRFIEINKGKCIAYLFHALINLKKPTPFKWEFLIKLKLLKKCLLNVERLAIFAGLTVAQLFTGFNLSVESQKLESTVFADFDKDGYDTAKISPGTGIVSFHEKFWNNFK